MSVICSEALRADVCYAVTNRLTCPMKHLLPVSYSHMLTWETLQLAAIFHFVDLRLSSLFSHIVFLPLSANSLLHRNTESRFFTLFRFHVGNGESWNYNLMHIVCYHPWCWVKYVSKQWRRGRGVQLHLRWGALKSAGFIKMTLSNAPLMKPHLIH